MKTTPTARDSATCGTSWPGCSGSRPTTCPSSVPRSTSRAAVSSATEEERGGHEDDGCADRSGRIVHRHQAPEGRRGVDVRGCSSATRPPICWNAPRGLDPSPGRQHRDLSSRSSWLVVHDKVVDASWRRCSAGRCRGRSIFERHGDRPALHDPDHLRRLRCAPGPMRTAVDDDDAHDVGGVHVLPCRLHTCPSPDVDRTEAVAVVVRVAVAGACRSASVSAATVSPFEHHGRLIDDLRVAGPEHPPDWREELVDHRGRGPDSSSPRPG